MEFLIGVIPNKMHIATGEEEGVHGERNPWRYGLYQYIESYISWGFKEEGTIITAPLPKSAAEYWYQLATISFQLYTFFEK